jgi:hypothetical protein
MRSAFGGLYIFCDQRFYHVGDDRKILNKRDIILAEASDTNLSDLLGGAQCLDREQIHRARQRV